MSVYDNGLLALKRRHMVNAGLFRVGAISSVHPMVANPGPPVMSTPPAPGAPTPAPGAPTPAAGTPIPLTGGPDLASKVKALLPTFEPLAQQDGTQKNVTLTWAALSALSAGASGYHGYKRHKKSYAWAALWALLGSAFPVVTPAVALAQGYGKPKGKR